MTQIPQTRKRSSSEWNIAEPACWNEWYAEFDAGWRAKWEAQLAGRWPIEAIEKLTKPTMEKSEAAVERMEQATEADVRWLSAALQDDRRKWFVANTAAYTQSLPEALFVPMLLAGVEEVHPDFNRRFIEPCLRPFGHRRVNEYLLSVIEFGNDFQKAGAVNALVWAAVVVSYRMPDPRPSPLRFTREDAVAETLAAWEAFADVREREKILLLETFVSNTNIDVRRSTLGHLDLNEDAYPDSHKPLVARAIQIARTHRDEYIQERLRFQLGESHLIPCLLPREDRIRLDLPANQPDLDSRKRAWARLRAYFKRTGES